LDYDVLSNYAYSDQIFLSDPQLAESSIAPGESKEIDIVFRPASTNTYDTEIVFHSKLSTKALLIKGQGKHSFETLLLNEKS
jgi:hypothetical protein